MVNSGVPWRYRYQYLSGGVNTAGGSTDPCAANAGWQTWNSPAGQFATDYINDSVAHSYIPVFTYYEIVQSNPSQGSESALLTKISTVCTMQAYWADFTVLMQKAGAYGGQVVVHVEPDFWGFMEQQSSDPTTLPAVVASSGNSDLVGLPNTVAGMGLAFLKLRDKYAPNAILGIHASSWAGGVDIATDHRTTVDPAAAADAIVSFIDKAGVVGNPSGITPWDVIFNDVADHDAAWYGALTNDHWWDRNNVVFPNFARWLAFMSRLHTDTSLPLVEWQVPVGNQYFDTMNNTDGHYQDNRAEYFLAHPDQLTAAGIVAVLFGAGNAGQTSYMDAKGDGVTNPAPVSSWQCTMCNNHTSTVSDDDGGFLRMAVGAYYRGTTTPCATPALSAAPAAPQQSGTQVTFTATTSGCANPLYEFWARWQGYGTWQLLQGYSTSNVYNWNSTGAAAGTEYFGIWVKDVGSSTSTFDGNASIPYSVTTATCASVTISAAPASPQQSGTQVSFTASGTCPDPNPLYEFWARWQGYSTWQLLQAYSTSNVYHWNSSGAAWPGVEYFGVWVKDAGSPAAVDAYTSIPDAVTVPVCASVMMTSVTPPSPSVHGTGVHVVFTAAAYGCPNPNPLFEFWMLAQGSSTWQLLQGYSTTATYNWNTTGAPAGTEQFSIWVRDANGPGAISTTMGRYDTYIATSYTLS